MRLLSSFTAWRSRREQVRLVLLWGVSLSGLVRREESLLNLVEIELFIVVLLLQHHTDAVLDPAVGGSALAAQFVRSLLGRSGRLRGVNHSSSPGLFSLLLGGFTTLDEIFRSELGGGGHGVGWGPVVMAPDLRVDVLPSGETFGGNLESFAHLLHVRVGVHLFGLVSERVRELGLDERVYDELGLLVLHAFLVRGL